MAEVEEAGAAEDGEEEVVELLIPNGTSLRTMKRRMEERD